MSIRARSVAGSAAPPTPCDDELVTDSLPWPTARRPAHASAPGDGTVAGEVDPDVDPVVVPDVDPVVVPDVDPVVDPVVDTVTLAQRLVSEARAAGAVACGVATAAVWPEGREAFRDAIRRGLASDITMTYRNWRRATDPHDAVPGAQSLLVAAWPTRRRPAAAAPAGAARVARYAWHDPYPDFRGALRQLAMTLKTYGFRARVLCDDNVLNDRAAAIAAGLGPRGKSGNILVGSWGPHVLLGSVVTNAALRATTEPAADVCGTCTRCVRWCPTGALAGDGSLDARRCLAWLGQRGVSIPVEFRRAMGSRIYGCDECTDACPSDVASNWGSADSADRPSIDPVWLLELDDDDAVLAAVSGWYVPRRDADVIRRNAAVVIGNTADPNDRRARAAISHAVLYGGAQVRAHSMWAAAQLGWLEVVADGLARETDPGVWADARTWL